MTAAAEAAALPDAGPCRTCDCAQWGHKRGRGGCKECGVCDKYLPPKSTPAVLAEHARQVAAIDAQLAEPDDDRRDGCVAEIERPTGERDAVLAQAVAVAEALAAERDDARRERDRLQSRLDIIRQERRRDHLAHQVLTLTAERDQAVVQRDQAYERVDEQATELGRIHAALGIESDGDPVEAVERLAAELGEATTKAVRLTVELERAGAQLLEGRTATASLHRALTDQEQHDARQLGAQAAELARLRDELDRTNTSRRQAQDALDDAYRAGLAAAMRVMWRYDAVQCLTCGSRYTALVDHEHPLTPVTVLVVERDQAEASAPADTTTKER